MNTGETFLLCLATTLLAGCVSVPADLWRSEVDTRLSESGVRVASAAKPVDVDALTAQPLTAASAVAVALASSPTAMLHYSRLGTSAADLIDHSSIGGPYLAAASANSNTPGSRDKFVLSVAASLSDIVTFPGRRAAARSESESERLQIAVDMVSFVNDVQASFYTYQTAVALAEVDARSSALAVLSADLAERFHTAGNIADGARVIAAGDAAASQATALTSATEVRQARADMAALLGLPLDGGWSIAAEIDVPDAPAIDVIRLLDLAMTSRVDLAMLQAEFDARSEHSGFDPTRVLLGDSVLGVERELGTDGEQLVGPTLSWSPPLFGSRRAERLRDEASLAETRARTLQLRNEIRNAVLAASANLNDAAAAAEVVRSAVIPARRQAVARAQEQLNFMLTGVFDVFETKQREYDAYRQYLETLGRQNLARVALSRAVGRDPWADDTRTRTMPLDDLLGAVQPEIEMPHDMHRDHGGSHDQHTDARDEDADDHHHHEGHRP